MRDGTLVGDVEREGLAAQLDAGAAFGFQFQVEGAEGYGGQLPFRDDALPLAEADRALAGRCGEHEPVGPCVLGEQPALPAVGGRQEIGRDEIDVGAVDPVEMHELVGVRFAHQPRCLGPCDLTGVVRFVEAGGADGHDDVAQRLDPFERSLVENAHQPHVVDAGAADDVVRAVVGGDDVAVASQCGVGRGDDVAVMPSRRVVEFRLDEGVESVAGALGQILFERGDARPAGGVGGFEDVVRPQLSERLAGDCDRFRQRCAVGMQAGAVERAVVHDHQRPVGRKPHVGLDGAESRRLCQPDGFQRVFARYGAAHVHAAVGDEHPFAGACRGVGGGLAQGRRTPCERGEKEQERIFHGRKFVAGGGLSSVFSLRFPASA